MDFIQFGRFSTHLRLNFSRTELFTAKAMAVGCVHHYSTHFRTQFKKSLEPKKISPKNCQKWAKKAILAKSAIFIKKTAMSFRYGALTSYQISEKSFERILRKAATNEQTNGWTNPIL